MNLQYYSQKGEQIMRRFKKAISVLLLSSLLLTGCSEIKPDSPVDGKYATQNKDTSLEYAIYMNKQIQVFINQISTRMYTAEKISSGTSVDNESTLASQALRTMQETYDETVTVNPSTGADDDREATLTAMQTAIEHMKGYVDAIDSGSTDLKGYVSDFQNDFNQLTSLANLYNQ